MSYAARHGRSPVEVHGEAMKATTDTGNGTGYTGRVIIHSGCELREVVTRVAYARNGNTDTPSKETGWIVFSAGRLVDRTRTLRTAKAVAMAVKS